ncbi:class I SAM-dependent methyltransferase [Microbacterium kyungheense]|uniref:Methyltransferase family protein n=1 Tax=Microbacterium kyungheense TaxID=1263636 RepID=A0A543EQA1_9MICO|nr:class I SAM-dependent methyltransferase [Microbacterium kyungheense]TQM23768.1 methyltransferase family protein [Microbacterium kyungheense]
MEQSPQDATLAAYERGALQYAARTSTAPAPEVDTLLARVARGARVLELGSGPGRDAAALEAAGLTVDRTDGAAAFVDALRAAGHQARVLDVRAEDFGGPYDAVFANAVLLHVPREDLAAVLATARRACRPGGVLVASVKKGEGEAWTRAKLDDPRHFTYWDETGLTSALRAAGWTPEQVTESTLPGAVERWITVIARNEASTLPTGAAPPRSGDLAETGRNGADRPAFAGSPDLEA